jgi:hypothetical protein
MIFWYRSVRGWRPGNITKTEINNWELWGQYDFCLLKFLRMESKSESIERGIIAANKPSNLKFNYIRTIAKDKTLNQDGSKSALYDKLIPYTPSWTWDLQLNMRVGRFYHSFIYLAQGPQWSTRDQLLDDFRIVGYETLNTRSGVDFNIGKRVISNINMSVYNILDRSYQIFDYNPEPGRHWEIQVFVNYQL